MSLHENKYSSTEIILSNMYSKVEAVYFRKVRVETRRNRRVKMLKEADRVNL